MRPRPIVIAGVAVTAALMTLPLLSTPTLADHPAPEFGVVDAPLASGLTAAGGEWEIITSMLSGNPHSDLDFFTQNGETFVSVGTLADGPNSGGQTIYQLTAGAEVDPEFVASHPSASCVSDPQAALGLQHDVEATPKSPLLPLNTDWNGEAQTGDAQLLIDATDGLGRCHDQGTAGIIAPPRGGLEIIDITDIENPVDIALTSHAGQSHTVNVDPKRPHIAYVVTSDNTGVQVDADDWDEDGDTEELIRANENPGATGGARMALDGFEIVDLSSCMDFPEGTTVEEKRGIDGNGEFIPAGPGGGCRPEVFRYRFELGWTQGTFNWDSSSGCHELEIYPDDKLACAGPDGTLLLDMSGAFDGNDKPRGEPLPCRVRASSSTLTPTDAAVIDCVVGEGDADLSTPGWIALGSPSLEGPEMIGFVNHGGRANGATANNAGHDPAEDIAVAHEAELTHSGEFLFVSDERGGGVVPPDASCPISGVQPGAGNGGVHAFRVDQLHTEYPGDPRVDEPADIAERAYSAYARTPEGEKAIHRAEVQVPAGDFCTSHVFQQIPGQNRIFMAWYSQGTQVVDWIEHPDGTLEWVPVAHFIPEGATQWTSAVFKYQENDDGTWTYWGASSDITRTTLDVYTVTLPPPAQVIGTGGQPTSPPTQTTSPSTSPSPSPGDTGTESPTATVSPSGGATEDPDEETPTTGGGLAVLGGGFLAASAALARHRARRSRT